MAAFGSILAPAVKDHRSEICDNVLPSEQSGKNQAMNDLESIRINGDRLWSRLMHMAQVGATPAGGCNRQALTDEDVEGRELFISWCRQAGCDVRIDEIGNIFARRPGTGHDSPAVMTGSHLDTQPTGGRFDGIYGVLAGLEVIETLNDRGIPTRHPIDVVVWTNEEGCRFDTAMMGSAVWSGNLPLEEAYALRDQDGHSVLEELDRGGHRGRFPATPGSVKAAFEAHIEQGPVLEQGGESIGIVTGVQHMSRHRVVIEGQEAHAGPTPMALRKDPVMALASTLPKLYALAEAHGPDGRVTIGCIKTLPGSSNTVPGRLVYTVDIRHPEEAQYIAMLGELREYIAASCGEFGLSWHHDCFWQSPGLTFHKECIQAVRTAVEIVGLSHRDMISGAGHDACNLASRVPASMIFIPCENGISHNEAESIKTEAATAGANVLLHAMLHQARGDVQRA
jgi:N-carbamoyl-L-amino-acid hydrolase